MDTRPSFETQICEVCLFDLSFSIRFAFGNEIGRPEYSLRTVVTIKNINNMKMISGIDAVGISESNCVFLFIFINLIPLWRFG